MGTTERRERERLELRAKILDAARELFVAEGYEAVTMRKVAEKIEYAPTAIYAHFKDKLSLIRELCETDFRAIAEMLVEYARIADPIERMRKAGEAYVRFAVEHPQHYRLMFMTIRPVIDPAQGEREDPSQNAYAFLLGTVRQALAEGRLRPELTDPELVAQTLWAGIHGVISLEITLRESDKNWFDWPSLEARAAAMADTLMRGLVREGT
jgi:AcrR family transcriptional regulator